MHPLGILVSATALLFPIYWILPLAAAYPNGALLSQYIGIVAIISMSLGQLISTRWMGVETIFGGLDRGYVLHKWLGIAAIAAILIHDTIDAEMDGLGRETGLSDLAETLGEISLYGLLILVVITITTFIPYHLWRLTHKLMGVFFAFSVFHFFFILKPFANTDPLGIYTLAFAAVGLIAYIYTLLPERTFRLRHAYQVTDVQKEGEALAIKLKPVGRGVKQSAGQFVFVSFDISGRQETHPFTVSSMPDEQGRLRLSIKPLGDYTRRLAQQLSPGTKARVQGPFGRFLNRPKKQSEVWVAGGIGITPFLAWTNVRAVKQQFSTGNPVHLIYAVRHADSAAHLQELQAIAALHDGLKLHIIESSKEGRLNGERLLDLTGLQAEDIDLSFCGPEALRKSLQKDLFSHGLRKSRFHYEEFEIRSGIGLWTLVSWLATKLISRLSK
jgi:predicted ferric reductase